jgi:NAD-dependent dihydropyrimidine dehydrogenase PreA subunit
MKLIERNRGTIMQAEKTKVFPNIVTPNNPVLFNEEICNGCNICVELCVMDILLPNPGQGEPPIILYPEECYYDGLCVQNCPLWHEGAIRLNHPLNQRVRWKRKATGEHFRIGMVNPPPPINKPPIGGWDPKAD